MLTIKNWVRQCLVETDDIEAIWLSCQEKFPHACASRSYILRLVKSHKKDANMPPCAIAYLIKTFNDQYEEQGWPPLREAATQLAALSARVKELEAECADLERAGVAMVDKVIAHGDRALRAEQELDEAYERLKPFAEAWEAAVECSVSVQSGINVEDCVAASDLVRRLASGPEKEKKE